MSTLHLDNSNFEKEVHQSDLPVLVDFWAPWCGPCRVMGPLVDELADELDGKAKVVKVDVNDSAELAQQYGVSSIPAFAVFKNGEIQQRAVGVLKKDQLRALLNDHVDADAA